MRVYSNDLFVFLKTLDIFLPRITINDILIVMVKTRVSVLVRKPTVTLHVIYGGTQRVNILAASSSLLLHRQL